MDETEARLGYPDLEDADFVYRALLEHGMFPDKLPPCFTSVGLIEFLENGFPEGSGKPRGYVEYFGSRDSNVPRALAIPHPDSYAKLCGLIKDRWSEINIHIGKADRKNYVHVGKIDENAYIFDMNYKRNENEKQERRVDYLMGCTHVVTTDISSFFSSVYSHSIPWALLGKEHVKNQQPLRGWEDHLDKLSRKIKDNESNGLLIGMHTSHILSEIILTQVDTKLCEKDHGKYKNYIRHIDDYEFYAESKKHALEFIKNLTLCLREHDLSINQKKTIIMPISEYRPSPWKNKLNRHQIFPIEKIKFLQFYEIQDFIEYALDVSQEANSFSPLNYAIHAVSGMDLSEEAQLLYVKRITAMTIMYPFLLPLLENLVFKFSTNYEIRNVLGNMLPKIMQTALDQKQTDAVAFGFYYAIKYQIELQTNSNDMDGVLKEIRDLKDCVSILLAWKYCHERLDRDNMKKFNCMASNLLEKDREEQDKYWLFLYEYALYYEIELDSEKQPFLSSLISTGFSFFRDRSFWVPPERESSGYWF